MEYKDYYKIMGVGRETSQDDIKRAYRKLARKYHPDVSKEPDAEARFKEVNEAYEVLKDPQKRKAYDQLGTQWHAGDNFTPPPGWEQSFDFGGGGFTGADTGAFSDFFESLFGMGGHHAGMGRARRGFHLRGQDQHARIAIPLEDAYRGATRTINLQVPQIDASGHVVGKARSLKVNIPKGVVQGTQIRLAGQGMPGSAGAPAGDLFLEVEFQPHPLFRAEGADIYLQLPVAPWEVGLGAKVKVPTLGGTVDLSVPAGAQSGQKLRLKGRGLPARTAGDQYAVLQVVTPKATTEEARSLYERMQREMAFDPRAKLGV